jgi:DeoR/GlpR family transcriptional regulator of sugar metabolism
MKNNTVRKDEITKLLTKQGKVSVNDLSEKLNVSKETIRKDLSFLEDEGILYRSFGGAVKKEKHTERTFKMRNSENNEIKKQLAFKCLDFIHDDQVIYIDASSTALYLAKYLNVKHNITVFTNSLNFVNMISNSNVKVVLIGGEYYQKGCRFVGQYALDMIDGIYFDVCISGMDGCMDLSGPASRSQSDLCFIRKVIKQSKTKILLADVSKFSKSANFIYANFNDFDYFITDKYLKEFDELFIKTKVITF